MRAIDGPNSRRGVDATATTSVVHAVRRIVLRYDRSGLTDGRLLELFFDHRDDDAIAALVRRHGPMVGGVYRRLLDRQDAEDAFQATFVVLVRKAASVTPRDQAGNWLYGVARRTALHARRSAARRKRREKQVAEMPEPEVRYGDGGADVRPLLDRELTRKGSPVMITTFK